MGQKPQKPSRRGFVKGILAGLGTAALASAALGKETPREAAREEKSKEPVLYRRTAETERYYKTLYS